MNMCIKPQVEAKGHLEIKKLYTTTESPRIHFVQIAFMRIEKDDDATENQIVVATGNNSSSSSNMNT